MLAQTITTSIPIRIGLDILIGILSLFGIRALGITILVSTLGLRENWSSWACLPAITQVGSLETR